MSKGAAYGNLLLEGFELTFPDSCAKAAASDIFAGQPYVFHLTIHQLHFTNREPEFDVVESILSAVHFKLYPIHLLIPSRREPFGIKALVKRFYRLTELLPRMWLRREDYPRVRGNSHRGIPVRVTVFVL